jgi:surface protein
MFENATAFHADIGIWNTTNVNDMRYMFRGASAFNQNIGAWNTGNVIIMANMFENATAFNGDIGIWNTTNVNNMRYMFSEASVFNQNIGTWNTANVMNMSYMFSGASAFNQDIGAWNTANVQDMSRMFNGASAFNQDIGDWDVSSLTVPSFGTGSAVAMLDNSGMSVANFDALLRGWSDIDTSRGETGLNNNIALGAATIQYTDATAFNHLTSVYGWTITSSGLESGVNVGTNVDDTIDASAATSAQKIHALNGSDIVTGSAHDDLIVGGAGNDTLLGGAGSDTFRYYYKTDGNDSIVDFDATNPVGAGQQGDVLDLKTLLDGATQASIANFITLTDAGGDTLRLDIHAVGNPLATADVTVTLNGLSYASAHALGDAVWLDNMITTQHIVL